MKIGFVLCEHPLDIRIKKEARTLADAGHEVVGLLQDQQANQKIIKGDAITVETYKPVQSSDLAKALIFIKRMAFRHIPIEDRIEDFARRNKADVLHVHDLPNVGPTIRVARRLGIPVVADLHENYPAAIRAWTQKLKPHQWLTISPSIWFNYQERCLRAADQVIVVIEESREFMLRSEGVSPDKVHVVANYVDLDYLALCRQGSQPPEDYKGRFVITYIGGLGPHRGIDTAVQAMAEVGPKAPDVLLLIIGNEGEYADYLKRLVSELGVEKYVEILGWQPFERVPDFVAASSIGLIPHRRNLHCDNTIPNKVFDYMGLAKPVIVSDCPPLARIARDTEAGLIFRAEDPADLARCIFTLYRDPGFTRRLGENGAAAVQNKYNWETAAKELVEIYQNLSTGMASTHQPVKKNKMFF